MATPGGEALGDGAEQDAAAAPPGGASDTDNVASPESKGAEGGTAPEVSSTAGPTDKYAVCILHEKYRNRRYFWTAKFLSSSGMPFLDCQIFKGNQKTTKWSNGSRYSKLK